MGGSGSGNHYLRARGATVEQCLQIDVRYLKRQGMLEPGMSCTMTWRSGQRSASSVRILATAYNLKLSYSINIQHKGYVPIDQSITLDHTPCNLGGLRQWLLCPECSRRVAIIYCNGPAFLCRHCYQLSYESQRLRPAYRAIAQKHKLGAKIFATYELGQGIGKPRNMHWKTFMRHISRYRRYEDQWHQYMLSYINPQAFEN